VPGDLRSAEGLALVDEYHAKYKAALIALFNEHKDKYAPGRTADLQILQ
jgi:hypothetical protein